MIRAIPPKLSHCTRRNQRYLGMDCPVGGRSGCECCHHHDHGRYDSSRRRESTQCGSGNALLQGVIETDGGCWDGWLSKQGSKAALLCYVGKPLT